MSLFRYNPEIHDNPEFRRGHDGYDRNQPRVPKGHSDGGQWTRGGGGAPLTRLAALQSNRVADDSAGGLDARADASPIQFAFLRESGEAAPGSAPTRSDAPGPRTPINRPAQSPSASVRGGAASGALLSLVQWLSDLNDQSIVEYQLKAKEEPRKEVAPDEKFRAKGYRRDENDKDKLDITSIRTLDRKEVENSCKRFGDVQKFTDEAVSLLDQYDQKNMPGSVFGTTVHWLIAERIRWLGDKNFVAEISYFKNINGRESSRSGPQTWGTPDTERLDALEYIPDQKRVCVYEIKTGDARWYLRRMDKLAEIVQREYPQAESFVLVQMKPTDPAYKRGR